jgi:PleD family two-component response regulator
MFQSLGVGAGTPATTIAESREHRRVVDNGTRRILVLGQSSPLLEGVCDLLQLAGYQVDIATSWDETPSIPEPPPNLVVVDLSHPGTEFYHPPEQIRSIPRWSHVPLLYVSFSGDERIRELRRHDGNNDELIHFYAYPLLGMNGLLRAIQTCMD